MKRKKGIKFDYSMSYYKDYDYSILEQIKTIKRAGRGKNYKYTNALIMADTETSKSRWISDNYVVAWTVSVRAYGQNVVTLYGHKPTSLIKTICRLHGIFAADKTIIYFHNLGYDWVFIRKFAFREMGNPCDSLNVKPYYPLFIAFENGVELRDSYLLAQRSLERWANDLDVEHKKAVGKWDYNKIRDQRDEFTADELEYIENDTLAGVECLNALMNNLHKRVYSLPYTATGIPRGELRDIAGKTNAHDQFVKQAFDFRQQLIAEMCYHGGYVHANRTAVNWVFNDVTALDFASSYPAALLSEKYPCDHFVKVPDMSAGQIIKRARNNAFIFKFCAENIRIKNEDVVMPSLQFYKCVKTANAVLDNGRILCADYVEIYLTEIDLQILYTQYTCDRHICTDVMTTEKDYLPRWYTDYIYQLFVDKTQLKGGDKVAYALAKSKLNSLYGLACQKPVKEHINEDYETGEYLPDNDFNFEDEYNKYVKRYNSILNYQIGIYTTAYAMRNLFTLGECVDYANGGEWLYSDTDSCYATCWDMDKVSRYNEAVKDKMRRRGYGGVDHNGREYWLGIAEIDGVYKEFITVGSKRYAVRKEDGSVKITVAGVPKRGAECLRDDLENFKAGLIFDGETTGKLTHYHIIHDDIFCDQYGNEIADSVNLLPCDYLLSNALIDSWEDILTEEVFINGFGEE